METSHVEEHAAGDEVTPELDKYAALLIVCFLEVCNLLHDILDLLLGVVTNLQARQLITARVRLILHLNQLLLVLL